MLALSAARSSLFLLLAAAGSATAAPLECANWRKMDFFDRADAALIRECLAAGADPNARNEAGDTPLFEAATSAADPAPLRALIDAGADVDARDEDGDAPIHRAAGRNSNPDVIAVLLQAGADPNSRGRERQYATA